MKLRPKYKLVEHFAEIDDPRIERTKRHNLVDILTIAILAVICGAEGWTEMES
ncbi:MAG: transposase family protein, partial [Microcystaceae cyanobacterium]